MALYGKNRDNSLFRRINRELISRIMCQEIVFYKFNLINTKDNIYGESKEKFYYEPVKIDCLISRDDQESTNREEGVDLDQNSIFYFLRDDLVERNILPERGDIIMWRENYFEIDNIVENTFIFGKQEEYSLTSDLETFGSSWRLKCYTHLTRINKLNIVKSR